VFVVFVYVFLLFYCCVWFFYVVACCVALLVGSCIMTYVILAVLVIRFGFCCVINLVFFQLGLEVFQCYDFQ
jgi:hypothetical protein